MNKLAAYLSQQDDIAVISHMKPDGDAVGSALTAVLGLRKLGKRVCAVLPDPVPEKYRFLPGAEDVCMPDQLPFVPKCAFAVDCGDAERMGAAKDVFDRAPNKAMLDHHPTNPGFGEVYVIDGSRASAGEIMLELMRLMGVSIDKPMADCLFVAVDTDTGNFNYRNTDARALRAAADCVEAGADPEELTRRAFRERPFAATRLLGEALARAKAVCDGKIVYTCVDDALLRETGARAEHTSRIVNYMNEISGVYAGLFFEQKGEKTKVSWRGANGFDVARIARSFGGGGHELAAGATLEMSMEEAVAAVLARTEEFLKGSETEC